MTAANPEKKKMVYKKIVHRCAIYNFSQIMSLPFIHNAHHCYSQVLQLGLELQGRHGASGARQDASGCNRMTSGLRQDGVRMASG